MQHARTWRPCGCVKRYGVAQNNATLPKRLRQCRVRGVLCARVGAAVRASGTVVAVGFSEDDVERNGRCSHFSQLPDQTADEIATPWPLADRGQAPLVHVHDDDAATKPPGGRIVIVDVDERSLAAIGQWPWRRELIGRLVARLREMGASTVALDVIFPEPERDDRSGSSQSRSNASTRDTPDTVLAETLRQGRVVLGYAMTFDAAARTPSPCVLHPLGLAIIESREEISDTPFFRATGTVCSLPMLAQAAGASGFLNAAPDSDGILRRVPLLIELDGRVYPGLALATVAAATGGRGAALRVSNVNASSLILDNRMVPLDGKSNLLLRYRGKKRTFPYVSAADVLSNQVPAGTFREKLVFVGTTALGTREVVATPLDTLFAGVEVQATVADNLLAQDFIRRQELGPALESQAVLALGIAVALVVARTGLLWGTLCGAGGLVALWGGAVWLLSTSGLFLSPLSST